MRDLPSSSLVIYTIGHSNAPAKDIVKLLQQNNIQVLVDVRSSPYSKYVPQFNREMFQALIQKEGLEYKFAGDYLGGRPKDPTCYKNGKMPNGHADFLQLVDYPAVMTKDWYQKGIQRLLDIAQEKITAIMCSEEDPGRCHRQHLISQTLLGQGIEVIHIRSDGRLQKAWLINGKGKETLESVHIDQMPLLSIIPANTESTDKQDEPNVLLLQGSEGLQLAFPGFLPDENHPTQKRSPVKIVKETSRKYDQSKKKVPLNKNDNNQKS